MYIYHLHNWKQIGEEKNYNGVCIRFLLEDIIHAENNNLNWLDLIYGTASRYDLRSKIYPSFMTYRKWIELSKNYPALIISLNFDIHSYKYKEFCKKILKQFPRNKNIIVSACNECYEKRGDAEKVYQTAKEVHKAMQEIGKFYPIAFWNEKIHTSGEISALEKLLNDPRVKEICEYFAFQSLGTSNSKVEKYVKMAKTKGYKGLDIELGTITKPLPEIEDKFKKDKSLGIEDVVILTPEISEELANHDKNFKDYALKIKDYKKDKHKIIQHAMQYQTKGGEDMRLEKYYYKGRSESLIKYDKQGYGIRFLRACFELSDSNIFDDELTISVREYQYDEGLLVDGKVGPETFGNMIKVADYLKYYCWVHSLWARDM